MFKNVGLIIHASVVECRIRKRKSHHGKRVHDTKHEMLPRAILVAVDRSDRDALVVEVRGEFLREHTPLADKPCRYRYGQRILECVALRGSWGYVNVGGGATVSVCGCGSTCSFNLPISVSDTCLRFLRCLLYFES